MANGEMLKQLRELAGKKEIDSDVALQLSLSATANVLEVVTESQENYTKLKHEADSTNERLGSIEDKLISMDDKLNGYHKIVEALQTNSLVKLGEYINEHKKVTIISGIMFMLFVISDTRHAIVEWLSNPGNLIGLFR